MGQDIRQFWTDVAAEETTQRGLDALRRAKAAETGDQRFLEGQTEPTALFIVSEPRRDMSPEWRAGMVCLANMTRAARCIVEGTHRRATAVEIAEFLSTTRRNYERCRQEQNQREGKSTITVEAALPTPRGKS
jgi:hypothetical protein